MANFPNSGPELNALLQLRSKLRSQTQAELRFDAATRATYASEASNYRQPPLGVVIPKTIAEMVEAVRQCGELSIPILPRGAGTSMCGQSVNAAVCIDHSKYLNAVEEIDPIRRTAVVQPGVICDQLKQAATEHSLTFGPDPATHSRCTLGGMIGNNSCGAHSVMAGKTVENIERLEVVTTSGERFWVGATDQNEYERHMAAGGERARIVRELKALVDRYEDAIRAGYPKLKRRVSGYNLDQLLPENGFHLARALVGSEGTCVTVSRAETRLVTHPRERVLVVLGFATIFEAADCVPDLLPLGPIAMEGLDDGIIHGLRDLGLRLNDIAELPAGNAWLMIEFGAQQRHEAIAAAERAVAVAARLDSTPSYRLVDDARLMHRLWSIRETGASATSLSNTPGQPDPVVGWEDAAVEPARLGTYLREFAALVSKYGYRTNLYGHFGDGCIHSRITFDLQSKQGVQQWRAFLEEAARLVVAHGGSLSGEHGDGQAKGEFLPLMYSPELMQAFREFKAIWDPKGLMNPGKLIDAMPADMHLRRGPDYHQAEVETAFAFGEGTNTGFARETERCIGMGKCRSLEGGTMCPSFKATREEVYSTRGRARLFFEMLRGDVVTGGWQDEAIKDSLDLCLACKGCKSDCPTHVDIPKYRSEFLSRYYQKRRRKPMDAMVGRIGQWLPLAAPLARPVNAMMKQPLLRQLARTMGLSETVKFPHLAVKSFRSNETARRLSREWPIAFGDKDVVLWVDTFNNGFTPTVLDAAVRVIENAGWTPCVTRRHVCCGRPLYDVGLLDKARKNLLEILDVLEPAIQSGTPVLVLEPSCLSVFRDELPSLLSKDSRALALSKLVLTTAEFAKRAGLALPDGDTVQVHPHCHQRACGGTQAESQLGARVLDTGCCGMAGAFGYHTKTAEIAQKVGEQELLPKLQSIDPEDVLVSDGFSCRCQISHLGARQAKHLVEVLAEVGPGAKKNN